MSPQRKPRKVHTSETRKPFLPAYTIFLKNKKGANRFLLLLFSQVFSDRMSNVQETQTNLLEEVKRESVKFGDDVKYLAEFTSGMKKFDPWIEKAEKKKEKGMPKPNNLEEANDALEDAKVIHFFVKSISRKFS